MKKTSTIGTKGNNVVAMSILTHNRQSLQPLAILSVLLLLAPALASAGRDVKPNRTAPITTPPPAFPQFSERPTEAEIGRAWVFEEPLVPMGPTTDAENGALASAIDRFLGRAAPGEVGSLVEFLARYPESHWRASLLCNLGIVYYRSGYFSLALDAWEESWRLAKSQASARGRAVADRAAGELAKMNARLGRVERLEPLLQELEGRNIRGPATERIQGAKEGLWLMKNRPEEAFRCGPAALERILFFRNPRQSHNKNISEYPSTTRGVSLWEVFQLSGRAGLDFRLAKRTTGARILMPAVVHWKVGHYAALLEQVDGFYHIQDPTFGDDLWISQAALEQEASGYFAVPDQALPVGWTPVGETAARSIWGKGYASSSDGKSNTPGDSKAGGAEGSGDPGPSCGAAGFGTPSGTPGYGMPVYSFHLMLASLNIWDIPLRYSPPRGPAIQFKITYSHREAYQPALFSYANLGNKWTLDWLSYVTDNPGVSAADVDLFVQGGGTEPYTNFNSTTSSFLPQKNSQAVLVRTSTSPIKYERRLPDGSTEYFEISNGAATYPRKVFLTKVSDPTGHSATFQYDAALRLVSVTDAIGQVTTLVYGLPSDTLKVTQVTDPFGRSATLEYNASGQLAEVTDVKGMSSQFLYSSGDFIQSLTTPYGTTSFDAGDGQYVTRWVQATDPLGFRERAEFRLYTPMVTDTPSAPTGMITRADLLGHEPSTIFWDKKAMAENQSDYGRGVMYQWLRTTNIHASSNFYSSIKKPLESRVWYEYQNQVSSMQLSYNTLAKPAKIGRVLDDGSTQLYAFEYNSIGNPTKATDPSNRVTAYAYAGNGIDLVSIRQKTGALNDLLDTLTYNATHQLLTRKDASGQMTTFTYDSLGQLLTATNPKGETTTYLYDSLGYLLKITGHVVGDTTVFNYDAYGRVMTMTERDGYTIAKAYDSLDRVTQITYPDSTYEKFVYNRLDLEKSSDRLGRWTRTVHNSNRQPVAVQDPEGRVTNLDWCNCGQLQTLTDPRGKVTRWNRDLQGRVTSKVFEDGETVQYVYEPEGGRLNSVTDAKGQVENYQYFRDNNLKQISYTNVENATPTVSYAYDSLYDRQVSMTDGVGTTSYAYNPIFLPPSLGAGRLYKVDGPWTHDTLTFTYDSLGRVRTRAIDGVVDSLVYDSLGRLARYANALGVFSYLYIGASGRLDTLVYPNGQKTRYSYFGAAGDFRLSEISHLGRAGQQLSKFAYAYDAESRIKTWTQQADTSTGRIHNFTYDKADQIVGNAIKSAASGNPVLKEYAYQYDKGSNRIGYQEDSLIQSYTVNDVNQLTALTGGGKIRVHGSLNEAGTLSVDGQAGQVSADHSFDGTFAVTNGPDTLTLVASDYSSNSRTVKYRVTSTGGSEGFRYDDNGNMSGDRYDADGDSVTGTRIFQWDGRNRLVAIVDGDRRTEFRYDGLDRRVQIVEYAGGVISSKRNFLWIGNSIAEERDSTGGIVNKRFFEHGYAEGSAKYFYTKDHLGSIREVWDTLGTLVARYDYDTFGNRTRIGGTGEAAFGYTGHFFHDSTGLHLAKYRAYNSAIGRWISRDPIEEKGGKNLYQYVHNNPVNLIDRYGDISGGWLLLIVVICEVSREIWIWQNGPDVGSPDPFSKDPPDFGSPPDSIFGSNGPPGPDGDYEPVYTPKSPKSPAGPKAPRPPPWR